MAAPALLDYSHFTSGTKEQREKFAHALLDSFEKTGFAKLKGHAFSAQDLKELFAWGKKFFDQPLEVKNEIPNETGPRPMRGYTPWRVEEVGKLHHDEQVRTMKDSKEHFDQGPEHDTEFPNKWPNAPELSGFQPFMKAFYRRCDDVCLTLMKALEGAWGIEDGSLVARCVPSATDLRLTHYPAIPVEEMQSGSTSRIAPHTDFGPITLLFQDSTGGLEIEDRSNPIPNSFVPLPPTDTTEMIVNVGDTLTRWTNGNITGGTHQVMCPAAMKGESGLILPPRMSMAYLFKAERNVSVGPLPKFVSSTEPAKYPDITALEFQRWKNSIVYNLTKKVYPNGTDGFNRRDSVQDVMETELAMTLGGVNDFVDAGKAIQPVQPV
ncbi:Clavaminate synthase-like protein [Lindgomyces ingoldianus]|uniref:Clavaminate synthase-like protein n=1 Tax=Lindgomyces ingoldianus TaxID=673940 RepID=A0ACB6QD85_9PLEO|nr:Clavaminate synthase-like protein [Lindgomyces ingoldianus]KAF2464106.1 Clavaminate synthase-like protein [Lindgomyces ingoldianus]